MLFCSILDNITSGCVGGFPLVPVLSCLQLRLIHPDILFVESAWQGWHNSWKYRIASYPDYSKRNNHALLHLLECARKSRIPTVFWDKEGVGHFERFIDSARHFDHVFTVDADAIPKYKDVMGQNASVHVLPFAVNPQFHFFDGFHFKYNTACFVGSYNNQIHPHRQTWQKMLFRTALDSGLGLQIYDRNSKRKSKIYHFPKWKGIQIYPSIKNNLTAKIYKTHLVSLNVNTNENSPTMVSRRLVEIIACGGIAVTTPSVAVYRELSDFCYVVHDYEETLELFSRLKYGPSKYDLERARAGAYYIACNHTWDHNLKFIKKIIGLTK